MSALRPGDLVDLWDEGALVSGVVLGEEKGRLRIVTERGDEIRVLESRVARRCGRSPTADPARAAGAAARHAEAARKLAEEVDVVALWDLLADAGGRRSVEELAGLALGRSSAEAGSAILRRLAAEKTYFERKGEVWEARPREEVAERLRRQAAVEEKARRRSAFLEKIRRALSARGEAGAAGRGAGDGPAAFGEEDAPGLAALADLAVHGDDAAERKEAVGLLAALGASGPAPSLAAFDLLVRLGVFEPDENLEIRRFGLRTGFPEEVERAAREAASRPAPAGRRDLTALRAFTIDDEETVEIDDALSWEGSEGGGGVAGIHIAAPSCFAAPGDLLDAEAFRRVSTYYFPDRRIPMIPAPVSEDAASLVEGRPRPALSFLVSFGPDGRMREFEIAPSRIVSRRRLSYDAADALLAAAGGPEGAGLAAALRELRRLAESLEAERVAAGAVVIRAPEVDVKVLPGGGIRLRRVDERGPSRRLVAELMILANRLAARFCAESGIPAIYRRQSPPESPPALPPEGAYDPVAIRAARRAMRRAEPSLAPEPHHGLGVPAYAQATSPLRRYQDLAVQRQIEARLAGDPLPYDAEAMARIAATTEEAERTARQAEAAVEAYFILKHLAARAGEILEGVIVAVEPRRTEVELVETLTTAVIAPRPDHVPGARLRLAIEAARPREGILRLRELGPAG